MLPVVPLIENVETTLPLWIRNALAPLLLFTSIQLSEPAVGNTREVVHRPANWAPDMFMSRPHINFPEVALIAATLPALGLPFPSSKVVPLFMIEVTVPPMLVAIAAFADQRVVAVITGSP